VHVVDSHGDALQYWQEWFQATPARSKSSILHIDSHSDMFVDWANTLWTQPGPDWTPPTRTQLCERILAEVTLANFQPAAVFTGILDSLCWLRSDFGLGKYNGPPPGHYRYIVGMPDYGAPSSEPDPIVNTEALGKGKTEGARALLVYWELLGNPFLEYGPLDFLSRSRPVLGEFRPGVPREKNTLWEEYPPTYHSKRPPVKELTAEFAYSVVTCEQLVEGGALVDVLERLHVLPADGGRPGSAWILDVDLDYFSTLSPQLAHVVRRHGWLDDRHEVEAFAAWAIPLGQLCSGALEAESKDTLFSEVCSSSAVSEIVRLPLLHSARSGSLSAEELRTRLLAIHSGCNVRTAILEALARIVNTLTDRQRSQWAQLEGRDWWWVIQGHCPHHDSTPEEVRCLVGRLEPVLRGFPYPPSVVTIARSTDPYQPQATAALVEWEVLLLVRRIWPASSAKGSRQLPALPVELSACDARHAAKILHNVHFHVPVGGAEALRPHPWPLGPFDEDPMVLCELGLTSVCCAAESLDETRHHRYFVVGTWSGWSRFHELTRGLGGVGSPWYESMVDVRPGSIEEFQILRDGDWNQRFFPAMLGGGDEEGRGGILGPTASCHGANWRIVVPSGCDRCCVAWDPIGARSVAWHCSASAPSPVTACAHEANSVASVNRWPPIFEVVD